jgi:hypothetical protein
VAPARTHVACRSHAVHKANQFKGSIYMVFDYAEHDLTGLMDTVRYKFSEPQVCAVLALVRVGESACGYMPRQVVQRTELLRVESCNDSCYGCMDNTHCKENVVCGDRQMGWLTCAVLGCAMSAGQVHHEAAVAGAGVCARQWRAASRFEGKSGARRSTSFVSLRRTGVIAEWARSCQST